MESLLSAVGSYQSHSSSQVLMTCLANFTQNDYVRDIVTWDVLIIPQLWVWGAYKQTALNSKMRLNRKVILEKNILEECVLISKGMHL